jgi:heat shock protein HtpX
MGLWQLRFSLLGTLAVIIGLSTLFFTAVLFFVFQTVDLMVLGIFVVGFNIVQWLISPYLIGLMYRVKEVSKSEKPKLHEIVERLSAKSGLKKPRVMVANIPIPNAFAYSSPIAGSRVAVTSELLNTLNDNEVEAVIGHELGHLKHRDVGVMMFVSILPALFYYIGYSTLLSSMFRSRDDRGSSGGAAAIGAVSLVMYFVLTLFTLHLSRIREYFADRHSAGIVDNGANKLSTGLVKIVNHTSRMKQNRRNAGGTSSFKALFISDPDRASADQAAISQSVGYQNEQNMVNEMLRKNVTPWDKVAELLSTHPNIVKRLRALQKLD